LQRILAQIRGSVATAAVGLLRASRKSPRGRCVPLFVAFAASLALQFNPGKAQNLDLGTASDCQLAEPRGLGARLKNLDPLTIGEIFADSVGLPSLGGSNRIPDASVIDGVIRIAGFSYSICATESKTTRQYSARHLLTKFLLAPAPPLNDDDSAGFSWDFIDEEADPQGGYSQYFHLTFAKRPVLGAEARVSLSRRGTVTALSATPITDSDFEQLAALYKNRNLELGPEAILKRVSYDAELQRPDSIYVYRLSSEGRYQSVAIVNLIPIGTISAPHANKSTFSNWTRLVIEAHSGALIQTDSSLASPSRFAQTVTAAVTLIDARNNSKVESLFVDSARNEVQLAGNIDVELRGAVTGDAPIDTKQVELHVHIDGKPVTSSSLFRLEAGTDPARDAAIRAYRNIQDLLTVLANPLDRCGTSGKCGKITANITTSVGQIGEYRPRDVQNGPSQGLEFGREQTSSDYGSTELQIVAHELVHAIIREHNQGIHPLLGWDGCTNTPGEPYYAIEESLADSLGVLLSAIAMDTESVAMDIGRAVLPGVNLWRSLKDPTKNAKFHVNLVPSKAHGELLMKAWRDMEYSQPALGKELVMESCSGSDMPEYFKTIRYINMGPINSVAYKLINFKREDRPTGYEDPKKWHNLLAIWFLQAASDLHCSGEGKNCTGYCGFIGDFAHTIRHSELIALEGEPFGLKVTQLYKDAGFTCGAD
jgi:hypothetical protein